MRNKIFLTLLVFLLGWAGANRLWAQDTSTDIVYLKNGAVIKGEIKGYLEGQNVTIDIGAGRILTFTSAEILRVERAAKVNDGTLLDWIVLFNGSQFKGNIKSESPESLVLELSNGEQILFNTKEIKEIWRKQQPESLPKIKAPAPTYRYVPLSGRSLTEKTYEFREQGWYHSTFLGFAGGRNASSPLLGIGLHYTSGFQFNRRIGAGLGFGFDMLDPDAGEHILSIYGEGRSFLTKRRNAPYVSLSGGYGFALKNSSNFITKADGGLRFHPAIGWRIGANKGANLAMDLGYIFQSASFTKEFSFLGPVVEVRNVDYRRLTFRMGLMF
jgi:hypothetical protein